MNTELFIARRITNSKTSTKKISKPIIVIAIAGIALGLAVMIISVSILTGFKTEIRNKVIGFGSHIQISNFDSNCTFETKPIDKNQNFYPSLDTVEGIKHIQIFATKSGILKTKDELQAVVLKGIGSDFDWSFFDKNMLEGNHFTVIDSVKNNNIVISKTIASMLKLKLGDKTSIFFIQQPPRMRRFTITGIYKTSIEEFDKLFVLVDIAHIQKLNKWKKNQITGFEILIDDYEDLDKMTNLVFNVAGYNFNNDGSKLKISTIKEKYPQIFDWLGIQNVNVWVILILMLLVAGFNMVSSLLIIILERTNMIGVLKSLGAENWSIRKIFLYQASFLTAKGLLWGNAIGIILCLIQKYFGVLKLDEASYYLSQVPINLSLSYIVLLNIGSLIVTFFMLLIPSMIISKISPIKTLKYN
ncbi:MAG: ABC transporter permease [Bacteroidetes bacterium]|nr:ABC transporter permease [Bacteroidota bacterium]